MTCVLCTLKDVAGVLCNLKDVAGALHTLTDVANDVLCALTDVSTCTVHLHIPTVHSHTQVYSGTVKPVQPGFI